MTYMKILSGHSSAKWIRYYLFKNDRAIDKDFLNLTDRDWKGRDWAKVMDRTREIFGNNVPVKKDTKVRTYEHFIISLDEKDDGVELDDFRDFVNEWASKWFDSRGPEGQGIGRFEVAIAYHDDNAAREAEGKQGILHAHLVINNTELETKRRISGLRTTKVVQAMRADLQTMSLERGWHAFATDGRSYTQAEMDAKGLKVSRGKRLDRAMAALDNVLANEAKGAQIEDFGEAMRDQLDERHPVDKLIPETFTVGAAPSSQPKVGEADPTASDKVSGFSYTTMRTDDGRVMRLVVPHGFGDSETMAERQIETREGWSWKDDIRDRVDIAMRISKGPADFASKLGELGIQINYNREGDIVYHHPSDPTSRKVSCLGDFQKKYIQEQAERYETDTIRPVRKAKEYIQNHFSDPLTLEEVSEIVGLSTAYFSALFKKTEGEGFAKYLINVRMEQAKLLLRESNLPVTEICRRVGYNDPKHFTHTFEKAAGVKPSTYRKLYG